MKPPIFLAGLAILLPFSPPASTQTTPQTGTAVSVIVTAEPKRGKTIPPLVAEDLTVKQGRDKRQITALEPLAGTNMQLLLMIDDSAAGSFDTEIKTLKEFVPANHYLVTSVKKAAYTDALERLSALRNFAAHESATSKRAALAAIGGLRIESSGAWLKCEGRFQTIVDHLKALATDIEHAAPY